MLGLSNSSYFPIFAHYKTARVVSRPRTVAVRCNEQGKRGVSLDGDGPAECASVMKVFL